MTVMAPGVDHSERILIAAAKQSGAVEITDNNRASVRRLLEEGIVERESPGFVRLRFPDDWDRWGENLR